MADFELIEKNFPVNNTELRSLNEAKALQLLEQMGGLKGLATKLRTDLDSGLSLSEAETGYSERKKHFGENVFIEPPSKNFFDFLWESLQDKILILLTVFSIISILLGIFLPEKGSEQTGWIEGFAILCAVLVVSLVTASNNYSKELKFRALNKVKNERFVKVIRGGHRDEITSKGLQVGDVVFLDTGDFVPADGLFLRGHGLGIDESAMTGEPQTIKKAESKPFMVSGCQVSEGNGEMLVTAIGMNSEWGISYSKLVVPREDTPLQENLGTLAKQVGLLGTVVAVLLFLYNTIYFIAIYAGDDDFDAENLKKFIQYFLTSLTLVVVAVPEGLPLAVTIALAYSMKSMLKDNNLVRHLAACETMGSATNICSDKTGTLTENRMTVTNAWIGKHFITEKLQSTMSSTLPREVIENLCVGFSVNSNAFLKFPTQEGLPVEFIGSKTECALLLLAHRLGFDYEEIRKREKIISLIPFSSDRKRMSTVINTPKGPILHCKGASEIVLKLCNRYVDGSGNVVELQNSDCDEIKDSIDKMASQGLRTLCIAYGHLETVQEEYTDEVENGLILLCVVGIEDPLRPEVPDAIATCRRAGIIVRMVTGDNPLTAKKIATDCGILEEGFLVMEGPVFRKMNDYEIDAILPKLRVLARSSPSDKHRLVMRLRAHKEIVAVTGDGTNDAPALKAADVGLAMGIAGTEIAKEASDIIIMDDNFASIVKAVLWGRNVKRNIQCFLQFQLTINILALAIAFIAAVSEMGEPLKPIQLLWVNLIQDSLAALALATEKPKPELLDAAPAGRAERLITPPMWRNMLFVSVYQLALLLAMVYAGDKMFGLTETVDVTEELSTRYTIVFNTFVFLQLFNEINSHYLIEREWNPFKGFFSNYIFLSVIGSTVVLQFFFVHFGGTALETVPLTFVEWLICIGLGMTILPVGSFMRMFVPIPDYPWLKYVKNMKPTKEQKEAWTETV